MIVDTSKPKASKEATEEVAMDLLLEMMEVRCSCAVLKLAAEWEDSEG